MSGGADSLALALLSAAWAAGRGGRVLALVVDHGLRPESASEAAATLDRLGGQGISGHLLTLSLRPGPRLAERARDARHAALESACAASGILHLLFGHHAADQAETVAMRRLRRSGPAGLAGMAALIETDHVRKLRPLLDIPPIRLRQTLLAAGLAWVEDPGNANPAAERARLRALARDRDGAGPLIVAAVAASQARGRAREAAEAACADWLGQHVAIFPDGSAVATGGPIPPDALAALLATIGGAKHPPPPDRVAAWLARPRPATLGGVRLIRRQDGWRLLREEAAMAPGIPAVPGLRWDGRFLPPIDCPPNAVLGPPPRSGPLASRAVPLLRDASGSAMLGFRFAPERALAQAGFVTSGPGM